MSRRRAGQGKGGGLVQDCENRWSKNKGVWSTVLKEMSSRVYFVRVSWLDQRLLTPSHGRIRIHLLKQFQNNPRSSWAGPNQQARQKVIRNHKACSTFSDWGSKNTRNEHMASLMRNLPANSLYFFRGSRGGLWWWWSKGRQFIWRSRWVSLYSNIWQDIFQTFFLIKSLSAYHRHRKRTNIEEEEITWKRREVKWSEVECTSLYLQQLGKVFF